MGGRVAAVAAVWIGSITVRLDLGGTWAGKTGRTGVKLEFVSCDIS
jgi:hypothetical protein